MKNKILKSPILPIINKPEYLINLDMNSQDITVQILNKKSNDYITLSNFVYYDVFGTEISCGVMQLSELPVNDNFTELFKYTTIPEGTQIIKEVFILLLDTVKKQESAAFIIMSNNLSKEKSIINDILESICATTEVRKNPKTNNDIVIYIY